MMGSPCGGRWTVGLVMVTVSCLARTVAGEFADYYDLMDYTGYDYSYDSDYGFVTSVSDCEVDAKSGKSTLNGTACDLNVSGDDLTVGLKGGITGIYRYQACQNGRPYYKRDDIKGQEDPVYLIYSAYWGDWDFCNSSMLDDANVLGYGGEGFGEMRPEDVLPGDWYTLKDLVKNQTSEDDFVSAPKMTVRCVAAKHPDSVGKNGKVSGGTCADGIMNADETGVDCGGADCAPCVTMAEQTQAVNALKAKLRKEWEDQQAESRRSSIAKVVIMVIGVIGGLFVCGGPILFLVRALRGKKGPAYQQLPVVGRPKK